MLLEKFSCIKLIDEGARALETLSAFFGLSSVFKALVVKSLYLAKVVVAGVRQFCDSIIDLF